MDYLNARFENQEWFNKLGDIAKENIAMKMMGKGRIVSGPQFLLPFGKNTDDFIKKVEDLPDYNTTVLKEIEDELSNLFDKSFRSSDDLVNDLAELINKASNFGPQYLKTYRFDELAPILRRYYDEVFLVPPSVGQNKTLLQQIKDFDGGKRREKW